MAEGERVSATQPKLRRYVCHVSGDMASGLRLGFALERVPLWRQPRVLPPAGRGMRRTHRAHSACANASPRAPRKALGARSQVCACGLPLNGLARGALPQEPKVLHPKGCGWQGGGARWCGSGTPSPRAPRQALGGSPRGALPQAPNVLPPKRCSWQGGGARGHGSGTPSPRAPRHALGAAPGAPNASPARGCENHASGAPGARFTLPAAWKQRQGRWERRSAPNDATARC